MDYAMFSTLGYGMSYASVGTLNAMTAQLWDRDSAALSYAAP